MRMTLRSDNVEPKYIVLSITENAPPNMILPLISNAEP